MSVGGTAAVRASAGPGSPGRLRLVAVFLVTATAVLVFYLYLYPLRGFRFPIGLGLDTPVYLWWSRYGGAVGLGAAGIGNRPGIIGVMATLQTVTQLPWGALLGSIGAVLALIVGLAAGALIEMVLGPRLLRLGLTSVLTATYLSPLVPGYFATLLFCACFLAGLVLIIDSLDRQAWPSVAASACLIGVAGLSHPVLLLLAGVVILGGVMALVPSSRRARAAGIPLVRTSAVTAGVPLLGAAAIVAGGLSALGLGLSPGFDTSRDAALRRLGFAHTVLTSYRNQLFSQLPRFTGLAFGAAVLTGPMLEGTGRRGRERTDTWRFLWGVLITWLVVTLVGIGLLILHFGVPGQRLALMCLPVPLLVAVGLFTLLASDLRRRGGKNRDVGGARVIGLLAVHGLAVLLFVAIGWLSWYPQWESTFAGEARQLTAAGRLIASQPPNTPLVLVADDPEGLTVTARANLLRAAVPPERAADGIVFAGRPRDFLAGRPTLTGVAEHDLMAADSWARVRPLLDEFPVAVVLSTFNRTFVRQVSEMPGSLRVTEGVMALPGYTGRPPVPDREPYGESGLVPVSWWLPPISAPLLLVLLSLVGFPWLQTLIAERDLAIRLALSPAVGLAAMALASIAVDLMGLHLAGAGGILAAAIATGSGMLGWLARRRHRTNWLSQPKEAP
jgi:hypothetical protein